MDSDTTTAAARVLRVLVVDDDKDAADSLAMLVRLGGHKVEVAYTGQVALLMARQQQPDVVLLDLGLPRMDGYQVIEHLRSRPETRDSIIIAVTGFSDLEHRRRSKELGFDMHLVKPIKTERLLQFLKGDPSLLVESEAVHLDLASAESD